MTIGAEKVYSMKQNYNQLLMCRTNRSLRCACLRAGYNSYTNCNDNGRQVSYNVSPKTRGIALHADMARLNERVLFFRHCPSFALMDVFPFDYFSFRRFSSIGGSNGGVCDSFCQCDYESDPTCQGEDRSDSSCQSDDRSDPSC